MRTYRRIVLLVVPVFVFAACGDDTVPADESGSLPPVTDDTVVRPESIDGSWRLTSGSVDGAPIALVDGWNVTMDVDGDRIGGRAACNSYGGSVTVGQDSVAIGELAQTEMGCEAPVMEVERAVMSALGSVRSFDLVDGRLTLAGPDVELAFEPLGPPPTADIVGTTWVLDTTIEGGAATNSPSMELATLRLNADGTLVGSTGCRMVVGDWIENGPEIVFTRFSAIDDPTAGACAPESERLDGLVVSVLGDGFTADLDRGRLTLTSQGGDGLSYTASE